MVSHLTEATMPNNTEDRHVYRDPSECVFPAKHLSEILKVLIRNAPVPPASHSSRRSYSLALLRWNGEARLGYRYDGTEEQPLGWPHVQSHKPGWDILPQPFEPLFMPLIPIKYHALVLNYLAERDSTSIAEAA
jgi:hypothetical protein